MKPFIQQIFSDIDGQGSSKRIAAFWILLIITAIAIGVVFFDKRISETIWDNLILLFGLSMGLITSEKFTKRKTVVNDNTEKDETN
jgi:hypothetical protein